MPGRSRQEFWFLLCWWMAQSLTLFPRLGMFALLQLQGPFPRCRRGSALGSGSEAADAMPSPIKLASAAMFHLTFPKEFTFLSASPPLPLFFESLSLQEREA